MKEDEIIKALKLAAEIENFNDCYKDCNLSGNCEGVVSPENLLTFLIENPHMQKIADNIEKIVDEINRLQAL